MLGQPSTTEDIRVTSVDDDRNIDNKLKYESVVTNILYASLHTIPAKHTNKYAPLNVTSICKVFKLKPLCLLVYVGIFVFRHQVQA